MHSRFSHGLSIALLSLLLAACGGGSGGSSGAVDVPPGQDGGGTPGDGDKDDPKDPKPAGPADRYALANGCYSLRSLAGEGYVGRNDVGEYVLAKAEAGQASAFFMKPTALGRYMLYDRDESLLNAKAAGAAVGSIAAPRLEVGWGIDDGVDWELQRDEQGRFSLRSIKLDEFLGVDSDSGRLVLVGDPEENGYFGFERGEGCASFPEIGTQAHGETFKGRGVHKPVLGFAEVHAHLSATDFLGHAHYGAPFHRFGVTEALGDGTERHGPHGTLDLVGNLMGSGNPLDTHDTQGWPTFADWPAYNMLTHEGTYYKWVERAWLGGLRLLVTHLVENEVLCTLQTVVGKANLARMDITDLVQAASDLVAPPECNEMESALRQAEYLREMESYIDAQHGGPGKGWFRIVESPEQARAVINEGKLAVVLGIEISHLFNCKVVQPAGLLELVPQCSEAEIDRQLERLHDAGVRHVFAVHEFDNALAGNGIFDGFILNVGNFIATGKFWQTYNCPRQEYFYPAGAEMALSLPIIGHDPLTRLLFDITEGLLPIYPSGPQCNRRWTTDLGRYAFERLMDKKMVIDVDHLELQVKTELLDLAEVREPVYPLVSTHNGHGGLSMAQARRIINGGGLIYPQPGTAEQFVERLEVLRSIANDQYLFAMGYGADTNGLATQPGPRGPGSEPVRYPFSLFQGPDWPEAFVGIEPVVFERSAVPEGGRYFDLNDEGLAHYGMIPDWVESVRIAGGKEALEALYNSAELYLRMWERVNAR